MKTGRKRKNATGSVLANLAGKTLLAAAAFALVGAGTVNANLDPTQFGGWSLIGDTDNQNDSGGTGDGAVDYEYRIGKFEVSDDDYSSVMGTASEVSTPKVSISLYGAMEYANALTEAEHGGSSDYNVYTLEESGVAEDEDSLGYTGYSITYSRDQARSDGNLVYAIPTEDEWYKAAYGDQNGDGTFDDYSVYANGETDPDNEPPEGSTENADDGWNYDPDNNNDIGTQDVGFSTEEQNGTRDMMGNVWEWQEDNEGVVRGGKYNNSADNLRSSHRSAGSDPADENDNVGFRVVAIPEPASGALFVLVGGLLWFARRRARA